MGPTSTFRDPMTIIVDTLVKCTSWSVQRLVSLVLKMASTQGTKCSDVTLLQAWANHRIFRNFRSGMTFDHLKPWIPPAINIINILSHTINSYLEHDAQNGQRSTPSACDPLAASRPHQCWIWPQRKRPRQHLRCDAGALPLKAALLSNSLNQSETSLRTTWPSHGHAGKQLEQVSANHSSLFSSTWICMNLCVDNLSVDAKDSKRSARFVISPISDPPRPFPRFFLPAKWLPQVNPDGIPCNT